MLWRYRYGQSNYNSHSKRNGECILCQTRVTMPWHTWIHIAQMAFSTLEVIIGAFIVIGQTIVINQSIFQIHLLKQSQTAVGESLL